MDKLEIALSREDPEAPLTKFFNQYKTHFDWVNPHQRYNDEQMRESVMRVVEHYMNNRPANSDALEIDPESAVNKYLELNKTATETEASVLEDPNKEDTDDEDDGSNKAPSQDLQTPGASKFDRRAHEQLASVAKRMKPKKMKESSTSGTEPAHSPLERLFARKLLDKHRARAAQKSREQETTREGGVREDFQRSRDDEKGTVDAGFSGEAPCEELTLLLRTFLEKVWPLIMLMRSSSDPEIPDEKITSFFETLVEDDIAKAARSLDNPALLTLTKGHIAKACLKEMIRQDLLAAGVDEHAEEDERPRRFHDDDLWIIGVLKEARVPVQEIVETLKWSDHFELTDATVRFGDEHPREFTIKEIQDKYWEMLKVGSILTDAAENEQATHDENNRMQRATAEEEYEDEEDNDEDDEQTAGENHIAHPSTYISFPHEPQPGSEEYSPDTIVATSPDSPISTSTTGFSTCLEPLDSKRTMHAIRHYCSLLTDPSSLHADPLYNSPSPYAHFGLHARRAQLIYELVKLRRHCPEKLVFPVNPFRMPVGPLPESMFRPRQRRGGTLTMGDVGPVDGNGEGEEDEDEAFRPAVHGSLESVHAIRKELARGCR
ncbi:MAG: hypothetical protein Q9211_001866 [Gyalolechia sp. 1 TL-2023]